MQVIVVAREHHHPSRGAAQPGARADEDHLGACGKEAVDEIPGWAAPGLRDGRRLALGAVAMRVADVDIAAVPGRDVPGPPEAASFMARRTAASHAWAVLPLMRPGMGPLDAGCGPGTITAGLAAAVAPGRVLAVDREPGKAEAARRRLRAEGRPADVLTADVADLPLPDGASMSRSRTPCSSTSRPDPVASRDGLQAGPGGAGRHAGARAWVAAAGRAPRAATASRPARRA